MKLWIDDARHAPEGYIWKQSTIDALQFIYNNWDKISHISLDHDAGDYAELGGDFIAVLEEIERLEQCHNHKVNFTFNLHSANPVGVANMRAVIQRNGWKEV